MSIHNVMEEIVLEVIKKYKNNLQLACDCERCINDIMAISLNQLPPRYIVQMEHQPYVRVPYTADTQGVATTLSVVTQAAGIVSKNPRCGLDIGTN